MSESTAETISLFQFQLENRSFSDGSLRILESILVTKDVRSLLEIRSALRELLQSEAVSVMGEIAGKGIFEKLSTVDFFVKAFALVGDIESCLALKYEALVLRETKCINNRDLRVSYEEWFTFAKDSLDNGFYAIAVKGLENALLCVQSNSNVDPNLGMFSWKEQVICKITELRDTAAALVIEHSVQAESANYLKRKAIHAGKNSSSCSNNKEQVASLMFRKGIKRRNLRKLHQSRNVFRDAGGS